MNILVDTHVLLAALQGRLGDQFPGIARALTQPGVNGAVSVVSLWEIAIKQRLGKLEPGMPLEDVVPFCEKSGLSILPIKAAHVIATVEPEPATRDPFDRLLLAQCEVEGLALATVDRALVSHRLSLTT